MGIIRDSLRRKQARAAARARLAAELGVPEEELPEPEELAAEAYRRRVAALYDLDDALGDASLERAIQARYDAWAEVMEAQPVVVPETPREEPPRQPDWRRRWLEAALRDRRLNCLYEGYVHQLLRVHPRALELEEYSELVCARALIRLLAFVPRGGLLLEALFDDDDELDEVFNRSGYGTWLPRLPDGGRDWRWLRDAAVQLVLDGILAERDEELLLARLYQAIPGSRRCVYRLLGRYKEVILQQAMSDQKRRGEDADAKPDGELPGEALATVGAQPATVDQVVRLLGIGPELPQESRLIVDLNLERAALAVASGQMTYREASAAYDVKVWRIQRRVSEIRSRRDRRRKPRRDKGKEGMSHGQRPGERAAGGAREPR